MLQSTAEDYSQENIWKQKERKEEKFSPRVLIIDTFQTSIL